MILLTITKQQSNNVLLFIAFVVVASTILVYIYLKYGYGSRGRKKIHTYKKNGTIT